MPYKDRAAQLAYFQKYTRLRAEIRRRDRHFWDSAKHANARAAKQGVFGILKTADVGIDWMTRDELTQSIPPAYSEFMGRQLMAVLSADSERGYTPDAERETSAKDA